MQIVPKLPSFFVWWIWCSVFSFYFRWNTLRVLVVQFSLLLLLSWTLIKTLSSLQDVWLILARFSGVYSLLVLDLSKVAAQSFRYFNFIFFLIQVRNAYLKSFLHSLCYKTDICHRCFRIQSIHCSILCWFFSFNSLCMAVSSFCVISRSLWRVCTQPM